MLQFQPAEREYLSNIRALSKDQENNEVFVGLTIRESVWYADYLEASFRGTADRNDGSQEKYLALQDRHEEARRAVLAADSLMLMYESKIQ